jgi:hypothetical protein
VDVALSQGLFADALILAHTAPDRARFLDIVKDYCDRSVASRRLSRIGIA